MRFALLLVAAITLTGTAHAGKGGIIVPPVEVDLGVGVPVGHVDELYPSTEILAGLHWASLAWRPTKFDFGVGYVGSYRVTRAVDARDARDPDAIVMHGGYLSMSTALIARKHWRTWLTARGELLRATDDERELSALGASLRVSTELFGYGAAGGNKGFIVGTLAIGIYFETTYRDVPKDMGPVGFTSGVTCRLPFVVIGG